MQILTKRFFGDPDRTTARPNPMACEPPALDDPVHRAFADFEFCSDIADSQHDKCSFPSDSESSRPTLPALAAAHSDAGSDFKSDGGVRWDVERCKRSDRSRKPTNCTPPFVRLRPEYPLICSDEMVCQGIAVVKWCHAFAGTMLGKLLSRSA
jgi:hypothetical protein